MVPIFKPMDMGLCSLHALEQSHTSTFLNSQAEIQHWTQGGMEHKCRGHLHMFRQLFCKSKAVNRSSFAALCFTQHMPDSNCNVNTER